MLHIGHIERPYAENQSTWLPNQWKTKLRDVLSNRHTTGGDSGALFCDVSSFRMPNCYATEHIQYEPTAAGLRIYLSDRSFVANFYEHSH